MTIDARILLGGRPTNISGNFMRGQAQKNRNQLTDLAMKREERESLNDQARRDSLQAQAEADAAEQAKFENLQSIAAGAKAVEPLLENIETIPQAMQFLDGRIENIQRRGGDPSDTIELREAIQSGRIDLARAMIADTLSVAEANKALLSNKGAPQGTAPKVLSAGQRLVDADGNIIAEGPERESKPMRIQRSDGSTIFVDPDTLQEVGEVDDPALDEKNEAKDADDKFVADLATELLNDFDTVKRGFGVIDSRTPTLRPGTADALAKVDQLTGFLSVAARDKMKGTGQISDFESKLLGNSATILNNPNISDAALKKELERIQRIFSGGIVEAPTGALNALRQNPELADQFEAKYGYLP